MQVIIQLSRKGIEPLTALTNSFTENHHYQSDHLPLKINLVTDIFINTYSFYFLVI
jgi:hypothetical protein